MHAANGHAIDGRREPRPGALAAGLFRVLLAASVLVGGTFQATCVQPTAAVAQDGTDLAADGEEAGTNDSSLLVYIANA